MQSSSKKRLILDCSFLNDFIAKYKFKLETLDSVLLGVRKGMFMVKLDLKSGYHHIPINEEHSKYLGFCWENKFYYFRVLPFGVTSGPFLFTKIFRPLIQRWRAKGILIYIYLDDLLILCDNPHKLRKNLFSVVSDLWNCGFVISADKCVLEFEKELTYLGFTINTDSFSISVPQQKLEKCLDALANGLAAFPVMTARQAFKIAGLIMSLKPGYGEDCLMYSRALYGLSNVDCWDRELVAGSDVKAELSFWITKITSAKAKRSLSDAFQHPTASIHTDASAHSWAGVLALPGKTEVARDSFPDKVQGESSALRELYAVYATLFSFRNVIVGHRICVYTDSSAVAVICRKGSMQPNLQEFALQIRTLVKSVGVDLQVRWVPRFLNEEADFFSKHKDWDDWGISSDLFEKIDANWGRHTIDLFANTRNAKVYRFFSKFWCPGTVGVDAFAHEWKNDVVWAVPPISLVPRFLEHFMMFGRKGTLVVPKWPSAQFWPFIVDGSIYSHMLEAYEDVHDGFNFIVRGNQSRFFWISAASRSVLE